jgi:hypothetical protein
MKQQGWSEILGSILKKLGITLLKVFIFILWVIFSALESLIRDLNVSMKKFLWPNKN